MPFFHPPTHLVVPPVLPKGSKGQTPAMYALMRHYGPSSRGMTVLKINGSYATYDMPDANTMALATEIYQGGHEYVITAAQATALTAAGYGAFVT